MTKLSDEWQTPRWLFDELNQEFNFDIDLCATKENSKCEIFAKDYLNNSFVDNVPYTEDTYRAFSFRWSVKTAFMNPPYSNPKPFIEKAWEDSRHCKIVCLVKCDPSTRWWATFWEYTDQYMQCRTCTTVQIGKMFKNKRYCDQCTYMCWDTELITYTGPKPGCEVRFFPKRIKFDPPQQLIDSGDVYLFKNKWVRECKEHEVCEKDGVYKKYIGDNLEVCSSYKGKGYKELSGPTFSSALIIIDRRGI